MLRSLFLVLLAPVVAAAQTTPGVYPDAARLERLAKAKKRTVTVPVSFNTKQGDAICAGLSVFPADNPWNIPIETWPLHPNSLNIVADVNNGADRRLRCNTDMNWAFVPPNQPRVPAVPTVYPQESDGGPNWLFPVPRITPIEGWTAFYRRDLGLPNLTLDEVQRDTRNENFDRHASVIDPAAGVLYEFYQMKKLGEDNWTCSNTAVFDLKSNARRPAGWTSADAAGLPIFPAVVRYDEIERGRIDHALRVTVRRTRRPFYVYPATHYASLSDGVNRPRMGERFRLRADFDISGFSREMQIVLRALKRYGMLVADNGLEWAVSVAADERIPPLHDEFRRVPGSAFEVVEAPAGYVPPQ